MRRNEEDEIQVLGTSKPKHGFVRWGMIAVVSLLIIGSLFFWLFSREEGEPEHIEMVNPVILQDDTLKMDKQARVEFRLDSINDVVLSIYSLQNMRAEMSLQMPSQSDSTVYFVVWAADIRKDNGQILGDFVLKGKQLSRGKRKTGYCAVLDGKISLGNTINDEIKDYCITHGGDFFRQYPLVMDGEIQENRLKGKAIRRALAQQSNDFYIVESKNRESLYDFSEALADMGFTNALYLVGGSSYGWWRGEDGTVHELGIYTDKVLPNINYLVFRGFH